LNILCPADVCCCWTTPSTILLSSFIPPLLLVSAYDGWVFRLLVACLRPTHICKSMGSGTLRNLTGCTMEQTPLLPILQPDLFLFPSPPNLEGLLSSASLGASWAGATGPIPSWLDLPSLWEAFSSWAVFVLVAWKF
jgi:hypothetical protein